MARRSLAAIPVALLIALSPGSSGIAQTRTGPQEVEAITVVAPRIITYRHKRGGSVLPTEVAQQSAQVRVGDLDLRQTADLYKLEERVSEAAARVCQELAQQFPEGEPSTAVCMRRAIEDAMAQVRHIARQVASK